MEIKRSLSECGDAARVGLRGNVIVHKKVYHIREGEASHH